MGVMEHIEPAGIHSGDSNAVLPAVQSYAIGSAYHGRVCRKDCKSIKYQRTDQYSVCYKDGNVFVIEANPRASRTTPFIAKAYQIFPYLNVATKIMMGVAKLKDFTFEKKTERLCDQRTGFQSFNKFPGVNKELGPEMKSPAKPSGLSKICVILISGSCIKERSMHLSSK
jgi:carbamoyl-phosphate synthase large subunit